MIQKRGRDRGREREREKEKHTILDSSGEAKLSKTGLHRGGEILERTGGDGNILGGYETGARVVWYLVGLEPARREGGRGREERWGVSGRERVRRRARRRREKMRERTGERERKHTLGRSWE